MARVTIFGLLGLIIGAAVAIALAVAAAYVFGITQAEGAYAMQVVFFYTPVGAVIGLALGLRAGRETRV